MSALLLSAGSTLSAQAIWTGPTGGGMLGVQEPWVAPAGHGAAGVVLDNYDRDPLGLDIDELRTSVRIGIGHGFELYGSYYFSRAVVVPGRSPVPPPPLDIVVASGPVPTTPYRPTYWPLPYLSGKNNSVGDFIPGEIILGGKRLLFQQRGGRPAVSASANLILPASRDLRNIHRGSGPASIDGALHIAAGWKLRRWTFAGNLGVIVSGRGPEDDRVITSDGSVDRIPRRPSFLRTTAGARFRIERHISLMAEAFHLQAIGGRTRTENSVGATDLLIGLQFEFGHLCLTTGYRQHMWPPPTNTQLPTGPLAGAINLSNVSAAQRDAFLASVGAPLTNRRSDAALVVTGVPPGIPLPTGASGIPATYVTSTTGNGGSVLLIGWKF
jgi:hypothetical protein